jgi:hypothetical protein
MKTSRYTEKMIDWVSYNGDAAFFLRTAKPTESISDARWAAMLKHIVREYLSHLT